MSKWLTKLRRKLIALYAVHFTVTPILLNICFFTWKYIIRNLHATFLVTRGLNTSSMTLISYGIEFFHCNKNCKWLEFGSAQTSQAERSQWYSSPTCWDLYLLNHESLEQCDWITTAAVTQPRPVILNIYKSSNIRLIWCSVWGVCSSLGYQRKWAQYSNGDNRS
jgi:hypothetical protein